MLHSPTRNRLAPWAPLALLVLWAGPAAAQPAEDPFAAIVSDPDGANARLNDTAIPVRNPTEDELRQYLEAFRVINLSADMTVDDREGRSADVYTPRVGNVSVGPFEAPNGTEIHVEAGFEKRPGEEEGVLRTLEMVPSNPMAMGPLRFNEMTIDEQGVLHFELNMEVIGIDLWPQEMTVEKIYRDEDGNLVFETGGSGLAGAFAPDMRVTPEGVVQRYKRGFLGIGRGWNDVEVDGEVAKLPESIPFNQWPPRATDIIDWFPTDDDGSSSSSNTLPVDALRPVIDAVPISEVATHFEAKADDTVIRLSGGGTVELTDHEVVADSEGHFRGRTYHTDPEGENSYRATATLDGELEAGDSRARVDRVRLHLEGEHAATIPFDAPEETELDASVRAEADAALSDVRAELPSGAYLAVPGSVRGGFETDASLTIRPLAEDPSERSALTIDRDENRYHFSVDGPVELGDVEDLGPGVSASDVRVVARDDPATEEDESEGPILSGEGQIGTKMGFVFTKTEVELDGVTETPGIVGVLTGEEGDEHRTEVRSTLKPGARVRLYAYTFAGIEEASIDALVERSLGSGIPAGSIETGAVNATVDARVSGTGTETTVETSDVRAELPGESDVEMRAAARVRHGTRDGAETEVRRLAAGGSATLREGDGTVEAGLAGGPVVRGTVGEGTSIEANTGELRRADPTGGPELESAGFSEGERAARLEAHLVLKAGSVAHRDLAVALDGRTEVDLEAAVGLRLDPTPILERREDSPIAEPIGVDLALGIDFAAGSVVRAELPTGDAELRLRGPTRMTLHSEAEVDASTGEPTLSALEDIDVSIRAGASDLRSILEHFDGSVVIRSDGVSTARIEDADVTFLPRGGIRIDHEGISIEIAPGSVTIGGAGATSAAATRRDATGEPTRDSEARTYHVRRGDTLGELAARFDTTVAAFVRANDLASPDRIAVGQELTIPTAAGAR